MREERSAILSLIAAGRISVAEAERLIAAWKGDREVLWIAGVGAALCLAQGFGPGIGHLAHALGPAWGATLHRAAVQFVKGVGGLR